MLHSYEMMYIIRPDLPEDKVHQVVDKYRDFLAQYPLEDLEVKILGKKRLAYPIQRFQDGIYVQMFYRADGTQVAPLERDMRLNGEVIRYLTIKLKPQKEEAAPAASAAPSVKPVGA